jgi:integrase
MPRASRYTRRKDGRLQKVITTNGVKKTFYARSDREMIEKLMNHHETQEYGPFFRDVAEEWWTQHEPTLSPNSLRNYKPAYRRALDEFGDARIRSITPGQIDRYLHIFGQTHAAKTTATQLGIINQIMRYARLHQYIDSVPTDIIQVPRGLKRTIRLLPPDRDVEAVRRHIDHPIMGLFAYLLLYSGLRRGEALALQYKDIDRINKKIYVEKSLCSYRNDPIIKTPKTEAGRREVPLVNALLDVLPEGKPADYLFLRDGHFITDADFDTLWGWYRQETGITSSPHQLRHWFATLLFDAGIDKFEAARYMGHTTAQMTEIYTHITKSRSANSLDRLNAAISSM